MVSRIGNRAWGAICAALAVALLAALARVAYGGPLDPPSGVTTSTATGPTQILSLPYTISASGSYIVSKDLTGVSGSNGITVTASEVLIDLNGFTLHGVAGSLDAIAVTCGGCGGVAIEHGVVTGWGGDGIDFGTSGLDTASRVQSKFNGGLGIRLGSFNEASDCVAGSSAGGGIVVGSKSIVHDCAVGGLADAGTAISVTGDNNDIHDNKVADAADGILVSGASNRIEDNRVNDCLLPGALAIHLSGTSTANLVQANHVSNNSNGIVMDAGGRANEVLDNVVSANGLGIQLNAGGSASLPNVLARNIVNGNGFGASNYSLSGTNNTLAPQVSAAGVSIDTPFANSSN